MYYKYNSKYILINNKCKNKHENVIFISEAHFKVHIMAKFELILLYVKYIIL